MEEAGCPPYGYGCAICGDFDVVRPMAAAGSPAECPDCGGPGPSAVRPACGALALDRRAPRARRRGPQRGRARRRHEPCRRAPPVDSTRVTDPRQARLPSPVVDVRAHHLEVANMPDVVFSVDQAKSMRDQAVPGHNRWHPDIPPAATVQPGSSIRVECREWTDGQIGNNDSANDVRDVYLDGAHMLSGPIAIEGAEPGDLLVVDILDLGPCQAPQEYGDAPGPGLGLHRHLRQGQRRRLPHRPVPRRVQGDLGLQRPEGDVAAHPRASVTPASPTPGCSAPRPRRSCWRAGTPASAR